MPPSSPPPKDPSPRFTFNWRPMLWYVPLMLLLLWAWQDLFNSVTVRTIPYSQFKDYLAKGQVVEMDGFEPNVGVILLAARRKAKTMICMYGMNDEMGLMHCARPRPMFLPAQDGSLQNDCSPYTAQIIDEQVKKLLDDACRDAKQILVEHRGQLELVAKELLLRETIDAAKFNRLIGSTSAGDGQGALSTQGAVGGT